MTSLKYLKQIMDACGRKNFEIQRANISGEPCAGESLQKYNSWGYAIQLVKKDVVFASRYVGVIYSFPKHYTGWQERGAIAALEETEWSPRPFNHHNLKLRYSHFIGYGPFECGDSRKVNEVNNLLKERFRKIIETLQESGLPMVCGYSLEDMINKKKKIKYKKNKKNCAKPFLGFI